MVELDERFQPGMGSGSGSRPVRKWPPSHPGAAAREKRSHPGWTLGNWV